LNQKYVVTEAGLFTTDVWKQFRVRLDGQNMQLVFALPIKTSWLMRSIIVL